MIISQTSHSLLYGTNYKMSYDVLLKTGSAVQLNPRKPSNTFLSSFILTIGRQSNNLMYLVYLILKISEKYKFTFGDLTSFSLVMLLQRKNILFQVFGLKIFHNRFLNSILLGQPILIQRIINTGSFFGQSIFLKVQCMSTREFQVISKSHQNIWTNYLVIILLLMSVKSFQELPFETLFQMAEQKYESLEYEQAEYFYELAYKKNPQDQMLVLCFSNLLKATDNHEKAKKILEKSIAQIPTGTYKRYMELADIQEGVKSIQTFERGIQIAQGCLSNPFKSNYSGQQIKRDIAQAYASIAQVCLTDLLEEKEAESKCIEAMEKGFKIDSTCIDIRVQKANYLMWKDDFETAKVQLVELHRWIKQQREQYDTQVISTIAKYLIEVDQFQKSSQLFEKLHEDSSNEVETIYMLAFCAFKQGKWTVCDEYIEEYDQKLKDKKSNGEIVDQEIQEAVAQLKVQLSKKRKDIQQTGEDEEQWMDVEDEDDFEA